MEVVVPKLRTGEIPFSLHYPQLKSLPTLLLIIADNSSKAEQLYHLHLFKTICLKLIMFTDVYFSVYQDWWIQRTIKWILKSTVGKAHSDIDQGVYYSSPVQIFQLFFHYLCDATFEEYLKTLRNSVYQMMNVLFKQKLFRLAECIPILVQLRTVYRYYQLYRKPFIGEFCLVSTGHADWCSLPID